MAGDWKEIKATEKKIIEDSFKYGLTLRGSVRKVGADLSVGIKREGGEQQDYKITIPLDEQTYYIPKKVQDTENMKIIGKYMMKYIKSSIPFIVADIIYDEEGSIIEVIGSMKLVKQKALKEIDQVKALIGKIITVNVLGATENYAIVEYKGLIQTISGRMLSHSEIPSVVEYIKQESINECILENVDANSGALYLNRKPLIQDAFEEKVIKRKDYRKGDRCVGLIKKKIGEDFILVEVERDIMGSVLIKGNTNVFIGEEVVCRVEGIDKDRHKLKLSMIN